MWRRQANPKPSSPATTAAVTLAAEEQRGFGALPPESRSLANISQAISIKGDVTGREDLFVDGEVHGSIRIVEGDVTVGPNGRITADIEAREIIIYGKVKGVLRGRERVRLGRSGQAVGEVVTRRIVIEEGAVFHGKVDIVHPEEARTPLVSGNSAGAGAERPTPLHARHSHR